MATEVVPDSSAFAYDRDAPLDVREAGSEKLPHATVHDLSFANPAHAGFSLFGPTGFGFGLPRDPISALGTG